MSRKAAGFGDTLDEWLVAEGLVPDDKGAGGIAEVPLARAMLVDAARERRAGGGAGGPRLRAMVVDAARERRSVSYSEALAGLGLRFSRPKMRAYCRTLDRIDEDGRAAGGPHNLRLCTLGAVARA